VGFLGRLEEWLYRRAPVPDAVFNLRIPLEVAILRNRLRGKLDKESDSELRERYLHNSNLRYNTLNLYQIDAAAELPTMIRQLKEKIWLLL
jgi:thymidylate kinase